MSVDADDLEEHDAASRQSSRSARTPPASSEDRSLRPSRRRMTATIEAVSTLPIGGSTRRSGITSGFVIFTTACASGLRKSARAHCSSTRSMKHEQQQRQQRLDDEDQRVHRALPSFRVSELCRELAAAPGGRVQRAARRCRAGPPRSSLSARLPSCRLSRSPPRAGARDRRHPSARACPAPCSVATASRRAASGSRPSSTAACAISSAR